MRRAIVVGASASARSFATYSASWSRVAPAGGTSSRAQRSARSRRYASTVRGARRVADSARNDSTVGSIGPSGSPCAAKRLPRGHSLHRLRARVAPVVDAAQAARVDMAVHLRRRERAVAQQLLDRAQVGAALE